ncbi:MAG: S8 family serine peptidase [Thermoplasmata archaeon]|nr:S8 family serine peptidase [Thermoplasmata archaeon]
MNIERWRKIFGLGIAIVILVSGFVILASSGSSEIPGKRTFVMMLPAKVASANQWVEIVEDYGEMKIVKISQREKAFLEATGVVLIDATYMNYIGLDAGTFDPLQAGKSGELTGKYFLWQFGKMPKAEDLEKLTSTGVKVLMYLPYNTYLIYGDANAVKAASAILKPRWVGNYETAYKVHPSLLQKSGKYGITIQIYPDENLKSTLREITSQAENLFARYEKRGFWIVKAEISHMVLRKIVAIENVLWVEPFVIPQLFDEVGVEIHSGAYAGAGGYIQSLGWQGEGVVVGLADTGLDDGDLTTMHPDLYGRVVGLIDYTETYTGDGVAEDAYGHGTHCAGIIAGNGATGITDENGYLYGYGVAPKASVMMQRLFDDYGYWGYSYPVSVMTSAAANYSVKIHSNSWGAAVAGDYDDYSQDFDWAVRDANPYNTGIEQITYVFAAGNSGPSTQTVGSPGTAKNVLTVAASEIYRPDLGSYGDNPEEIAGFSSRGPTADGRWKPEITGVGTWVASALSSSASPGWGWGNINEYYEWCGGTSMATPHVAGGAVLFFEYYSKTFGKDPSPALVKAALINGADDMLGGPNGGSAPVPNKDEGWGRMNLTKVIQPDFGVVYVDGDYNLKTGEIYEKDVKVIDASKPLKVTMSYLDIPGAISANPTLVNDLNLIVIAPDNTMYYGNAFANGWSMPAIGSPDNKNNLENVFIKQPMPGTYRIIVSALNVPQDAVNGTPEMDQDFALAVSGNIEAEHPGTIRLDKEYYQPTGTVKITVVDQDLNTNPSQPETVSVKIESMKEPYGETIILTEDGANTGRFTGTIPMRVGVSAPGNGYLEVGLIDNLVARYMDLAPMGERTAKAFVDGFSPAIWGVGVTSLTSKKATIEWMTDEPATSVVYYWEEGNPVPVKTHGKASNLKRGFYDALAEAQATPGKDKTSLRNEMGIKVVPSATSVITMPGYVTHHIVELKNLKPETKYFFYVESVDQAGNSAMDNNNSKNYTFTTSSPATILLVDDDLGANYEVYFTKPLTLAGYSFDVWDVYVDGSPGIDTLNQYEVVIWTTGDDWYSTLSASDEANLGEYLDGGGKLFLSSQDYLYDAGLTSFGMDYLHIGAYDDDYGATYVVGVSGDPISGGLGTVRLLYPYWDFTDHVEPDATAFTVFKSNYGYPCAIRYEDPDGFRTVFFGFPFEAISNQNITNGTVVIDRIIKWLNPPQQHDLVATSLATNRSWSQPGESVTITAKVKNKGLQAETNIEVKFYADGNVIDVKYIPTLAPGKETSLNTSFTFPVEGVRPIAVEITPVTGENLTGNNIKQGKAYVRVPTGPIKIGVVDSFGADNSPYMVWAELENTWYRYSNYMFEFDVDSLNIEDITLDDLIETNADVLFISDAWYNGYGWEFTDAEIQAIKTYAMMAHGIIATSGTFGDSVPNNMKLADAFGFDTTHMGYWADTIASPFTFSDPTHPLFNDMTAPYMPGLLYACVLLSPTNATVLGVADTYSDYAYITEYKYAAAEAIYFGHIPEYAGGANAQDVQLVANAIIWAYKNTSRLAHDLFPTSLTLPDYAVPGQQVYLNTTVMNAGTSAETNVVVDLIVNSVVVGTKVISSIAPGALEGVSFSWSPTAEGIYQIQIYVHEVAGETVSWNNRINGEVYVVTPKGPIKVAMVDSWGLDNRGYTIFSELEQNWYKFGSYMIEFDFASLNKEAITSKDLISTESHVVFISNAWDDGTYTGQNWEFTDAEIQALKDFIYYGHGAVATSGTFGDTATNNMKLAPAFGIAQSPSGFWADVVLSPPGFTVLAPTHPVFTGISNPYLTGEEAGGNYVNSRLTLAGATKLANATTSYSYEAVIVNYTYGYGATVYTSNIAEYTGLACKADKQLIYNAIVYAFRNTTYLPLLLHTPVISAAPNAPIPISVVAKEFDDGVKNVTLYYTNVGSSTYNAVQMVRTSGDSFNGTWNATIPSQTVSGDVRYYFVAYDNGGHSISLPIGAPGTYYTIVIDATPPVITHTPPASIEVGTGCGITATVTDNGELKSAYLNYTDVNGNNYNVSMYWMGGNTYTYFLPLQNKTGTVWYKIAAVDKIGNWNFTPMYSVPVVDSQEPVIQHLPVQRADAMVPFDIICKVTDNYGVQTVKLRYTTPTGQTANVTMSMFSSNYYKYTVPGQPLGDFKYYIYAVDKAGNDAITPEYTVPVVDIVPPVIRLLYPTPVVNTSHLTIFAYCDDSMGYSGLLTAFVHLDYIDFTNLIVYDGDYINCTIPFSLNDGTHILQIQMFDKFYNYAILTTTFEVDSTAPSLTVTNPLNGAVLPVSDVNVTGHSEPGATVTVNGNAATVLPSGDFYCEITLNEGANTITVISADSAGNTNKQQLDVIVDTIDPVVTIYTPSDNAVLNSGEVLVTGKVVEANLDKVEVNGIMVDVATDGSFAKVLYLGEGSHTISVKALDRAGHQVTETVSISIDSIAPAITVTNPLQGTYMATTSINVTGTTEPGAAVKVNGYNATVFSDGTFYYVLSVSDGPLTITVVSIDAAGNTNTKQINVVVDATAPVITIANPPNNSVFNKSTVLVSGTIVEANLKALSINGIGVSVGTGGTFGYYLTLADGTHEISVVAEDLAGNKVTVKRTVIVDTTAPTITVATPADAAYLGNKSVVVSGTTEPGATLKVNGNTIQVSSGGSFSAEITLAEGTNEILFFAEDVAHNTYTAKIKVIVDTIAPVVTIAQPGDNSLINTTTVMVYGSVNDANLKSVKVNGVQCLYTTQGEFLSTVALSEGDNTIRVVAEDWAGHTTTEELTVTVDITPPLLRATVPAATSETRCNVNGTTEPGAELYINGERVNVGVDGSFSKTIDLKDGSNLVVIKAIDAAGNVNTLTYTVLCTKSTSDQFDNLNKTIDDQKNLIDRLKDDLNNLGTQLLLAVVGLLVGIIIAVLVLLLLMRRRGPAAELPASEPAHPEESGTSEGSSTPQETTDELKM